MQVQQENLQIDWCPGQARLSLNFKVISKPGVSPHTFYQLRNFLLSAFMMIPIASKLNFGDLKMADGFLQIIFLD